MTALLRPVSALSQTPMSWTVKNHDIGRVVLQMWVDFEQIYPADQCRQIWVEFQQTFPIGTEDYCHDIGSVDVGQQMREYFEQNYLSEVDEERSPRKISSDISRFLGTKTISATTSNESNLIVLVGPGRK